MEKSVNIATFSRYYVKSIKRLNKSPDRNSRDVTNQNIVFNLPMNTVTIVEDPLMIIMSGGMLFATL